MYCKNWDAEVDHLTPNKRLTHKKVRRRGLEIKELIKKEGISGWSLFRVIRYTSVFREVKVFDSPSVRLFCSESTL